MKHFNKNNHINSSLEFLSRKNFRNHAQRFAVTIKRSPQKSDLMAWENSYRSCREMLDGKSVVKEDEGLKELVFN